ncbi:MAG TPA: peptidoglycan bridge formation glycyltransferase FemA/FemB family protein [Planctomycetota bacterium]
MALSYEPDPSLWDEYVGAHPHGHHEQTSRFAEMRSRSGFRCLRVAVLAPGGHIVGGAQVLLRSVPVAGTLACVTQGPLVSAGMGDAAIELLHGLDVLARNHGITRMRLINYFGDSFWQPLLEQAGYHRSGYQWAERDTQLLRCDRTDDQLISGMHDTCRRNLRSARNKGVSVRVAGEEDISTVHQLLQETAQRRGFPIFPLEYFQRTWRLFAPRGKLRAFLAYSDDVPLAGVITTVIGDRACDGWAGMSMLKSNTNANYAAHWAAIRWARGVGCGYYDFSGGTGDDGLSVFKQRWGSEAVPYPDPFDKFYGLASGLRRSATGLVWRSRHLRRIVNRIGNRLHARMPY